MWKPLGVVVLLAGSGGCGRATSDPPAPRPASTVALAGCAGRAWFQDRDGDGFGDPEAVVRACLAPEGYVDVAGDCLDTNGAVHPDAPEQCDAGRLDEDCDGWKDDEDPGPVEGQAWCHPDADGDGHGVPAGAVPACVCAAGYVVVDDDCDDTRADVHPGAAEVCDDADVDEDCNGLSDDEEGLALGDVWYRDGDGDGWGGESAVYGCDAAAGYVVRPGDCDDADPLATPDDLDGDGASGCDGDCDDADPSVLRADCPYVSAYAVVTETCAFRGGLLPGSADMCPDCDYVFSGPALSDCVSDVGMQVGWDIDEATVLAVLSDLGTTDGSVDWTATHAWDVELWEGTGSYDELSGWTDHDAYVRVRLYR